MVVIDGEVRESFNFHVQPNPKADITQEALDVAGVTKEQIMAYPPMGEVYRQFVDMLAKYVDKYNGRISSFLPGTTMPHLITSFSVHGSCRMKISISDRGSGAIL